MALVYKKIEMDDSPTTLVPNIDRGYSYLIYDEASVQVINGYNYYKFSRIECELTINRTPGQGLDFKVVCNGVNGVDNIAINFDAANFNLSMLDTEYSKTFNIQLDVTGSSPYYRESQGFEFYGFFFMVEGIYDSAIVKCHAAVTEE